MWSPFYPSKVEIKHGKVIQSLNRQPEEISLKTDLLKIHFYRLLLVFGAIFWSSYGLYVFIKSIIFLFDVFLL